jgi:hypothetical protein
VDRGAFRTLISDANEAADGGCAFILDAGASCGGTRQPGSPYCEHHHALCHVAGGSPGERRRLRETEALARAVGGRRGRSARTPPERVLRRLENLARAFARPDRSCIVLKEGR